MTKSEPSIELINQTQKRVPRKKLVSFASMALRILAKDHRLQFELASLTLVFVSKSSIRKINQQYRNKDKPTDVLSFSADEGLGELVLCYEVIQAYAKEHGVRTQDELTYVVLHGILHLLGYDHEGSKKKADQMFQLQDKLYNRLAKHFSLKPVQKSS